jgi:hypothetical protein
MRSLKAGNGAEGSIELPDAEDRQIVAAALIGRVAKAAIAMTVVRSAAPVTSESCRIDARRARRRQDPGSWAGARAVGISSEPAA